MLAHIKQRRHTLYFSGFGACGDPTDGAGIRSDAKPTPYFAVVDVGRAFIITGEGDLYIIGPGPHQFSEWTPSGLYVAARDKMFGFRLKDEPA